MNKNKNDIAWEKLFDKYKIDKKVESEGSFIISSTDINQFREARLMTKFDYKSNLPKLFSENNLSILPISRGYYIISTFEAFQKLDKNEVETVKVTFPSYLESVDYQNISGESSALHCAYISGIIEQFTEEVELIPTVSGRMKSEFFSFDINTTKGIININVDNSQIEIDGGYEGFNSLNLIEAKVSLSDDFIIRQLYYPFRKYVGIITKPVRPIFLIYSNGIFHLREYKFENINHYNSLKLIRQKNYIIYDRVINLETIQDILNSISIVKELKIPFPQADSFKRVINLCELLNEKDELTKEEITENYDFDKRQTNYYTDAGRYLGLIDKKKETGQVIYFLTKKGKNLFKLSIINRQLEFIKLILSHLAFHKTLKCYFDKCNVPTKTEIVEIMKASNLYNVDSETTFHRRASTILGWINWILEQIDE